MANKKVINQKEEEKRKEKKLDKEISRQKRQVNEKRI